MTYPKASKLCSKLWCRQPTLEGQSQCAGHFVLTEQMARVDRKPLTGTERRFDWDYLCSSCGRGEYLKLTEAEAGARRPARCAREVCGGRMLLTRADVGHLGSSFDPSVPTRATYKVARTS